MFLDISKAFDKVWHDGLIFKLKCNGISENLLKFLESNLQNRHQRAVLNGTVSDWRSVTAGVPQGSVLGPFLLLVYINAFIYNISSQMRLFADDSSLFTRVEGVDLTHEKLVKDMQTITNWALGALIKYRSTRAGVFPPKSLFFLVTHCIVSKQSHGPIRYIKNNFVLNSFISSGVKKTQ